MNSKSKGNQFERTICKTLSLWITNQNNDSVLWRSIGSGSFNTNRLKKNKESNSQEGDLTYISEEGKEFINTFSVECKAYKHIELYKLFNQTSEITKWYNKLLTETIKHPLLIIKSNNKDILIATNELVFNTVGPSIHINIENSIYLFQLEELLSKEYNYFIKELT